LITTREFTVENNTLTPTMKLKRNDAKIMFLKEIKELYDNAKLQGED
jgi:long-subunit acyl-CoA synthetase (AMP-forming)